MIDRRSEKEQEDFLDAAENEIICDESYCPFITAYSSPSNPTCEGRYCDLAWDEYCRVHNKVYER